MTRHGGTRARVLKREKTREDARRREKVREDARSHLPRLDKPVGMLLGLREPEARLAEKHGRVELGLARAHDLSLRVDAA